MKKSVSCEFFPPHSEQGMDSLKKVYERLNQSLCPDYFSVTFGAGGSTQERTFETVDYIQANGTPAAPHISCIASSREKIRLLLEQYRNTGIKRLVALRGDKPSGWMGRIGEFAYANELVSFIREETGDYFHIEVAAYPEFHPQAKSAIEDINFFKQKVEAGANAAITQYFYNADSYFYFLDECNKKNINIPIIPGIMPINQYEQLRRFSDTCGADIPRWLRWRLESLESDLGGLQQFGIEFVSDLCQRLLAGGAPGLHFYTLNKVEPTLQIARNLGLAKD